MTETATIILSISSCLTVAFVSLMWALVEINDNKHCNCEDEGVSLDD